jgi:hypothetical protein
MTLHFLFAESFDFVAIQLKEYDFVCGGKNCVHVVPWNPLTCILSAHLLQRFQNNNNLSPIIPILATKCIKCRILVNQQAINDKDISTPFF